MKKFRGCLSSFLSICMLMGMISIDTKAETNDGTKIIATELENSSRIEELHPNQSIMESIYKEDEFVTAIIELEEAPVMEYYTGSSYFSNDDDTSPGESVAKFLASQDVKEASDEISKNQENIIANIKTIFNKNRKVEARSSESFKVVKQWNTVVNAVAVNIPYGMLKEIRKIDGVKSAYVEHTYDLPEPVKNSVVEEGKETYSYSYDMVGVEEAWKKGYTGKGLLVAVLDTGLDIKTNNYLDVVREHEAFTEDSFYSGNPTDGNNDWDLRYTKDSIKEFLNSNQINSNTDQNGDHLIEDKIAAYKNVKIPYACDYSEGDFNVFPTSNHGTHVAGTISGFTSTEEGEIKFSGISPDAQMLIMKVFPDVGEGARESFIVNALEDSLKLGADVINLSLGSDNGFADDDTIQNGMYDRINSAGVVIMTAAGNSAKSSESNNYGGNNITSNPDESMISAPAVYDGNLAVASIDNTISVQSYLTWDDKEGIEHKVYFKDPWAVAMKADFTDGEYPIYSVGGVGNNEDYAKVGFNNGYNDGKTGFALVKRGEISFVDKINNALSFSGVNSQGEKYGVIGVIIYDNNPESTELISMGAEGTSLDSAFISGKDGAELVKALEDGQEIKIRVSKEDDTIDNKTAGEMSSFSSWGAGQGLELKPEITAPGGNIWSSIVDATHRSNENYKGSYGMMSGTSMATPHMTGIGSLVRQYVLNNSAFKGISTEEVGNVVNSLLVSTAVPQKDENGVYHSPRRQGAGLVNLASAVSTPAYVTVDGKNVGKLELGDDPNKDGVLDISFNLNNISNNKLSYNAEVVLMRPATGAIDSLWGERNVIQDNEVVIKTVSLGEISVEAENSTSFSKSISLSDGEKAKLDELFENGIYVEGYVILTDSKETGNPRIGLPIISYYGDWSKSPIFDSSLWTDEPTDKENVLNNETTWANSVVASTMKNDIYGVIGYFNLGQNIFDPLSVNEQGIYHKQNITISPNGDEYLDRIDDYLLYQLRDAKAVVIEAKDAETGEVYMRDWTSYSTRSLYNPDYRAVIPFSVYGTYPTWDGTDMKGNTLPTGTKCIYTITAYGDGDYGDKVYNEDADRNVTDFDSIVPGEKEPTFNKHKMDMTGDVISFPVTIDTVAPKLEDNAVTFYEEDGRTYIKGKVYDEDGSIASIEIAPFVRATYKEGFGDPSYSQVIPDRDNTFYLNNIYDAETKESTFTADVTEYVHKNEAYPGQNESYNYEWTGDILLSCGDYGANDRSYAIKVDNSDGIILSQTSALLKPNSSFELSVTNNTNNPELTFTSSNLEVATVNEEGCVTAISPGQSIITVSNGKELAICIVAVEEENPAISDFELSIDKFSGLKPDGEVVVKVKNIQPANCKIDSIGWEVSEDEDYANDYAAGLITVGKNSSDALSGSLYLTIQATPEEVTLPAGHAVLTVTIDGIKKTMDIDWNEIYKSIEEDDIISADVYNSQTIYVKPGEAATLYAKYRQSELHNIGDVETELVGLKLDGPDFFCIGGKYKAKLVNEEGYGIPEEVKLYTLYSDGYKVELPNYSWNSSYTYDKTTGEIDVEYAPNGADNKLLIVAEGIEVEGATEGIMSGEVYEKPDGLFGPFDWEVTEGDGPIETLEEELNGTLINVAKYTPDKPGVSYIKATTKDGKYSVNFAVICEPILPEKLTLNKKNIEIKAGEKEKIATTLSPTPTLEKDEKLIWKSFNPSVASVEEDGTIVGVSEGYAYIKVSSATNSEAEGYCIVKVNENIKKYQVVFKNYDGTILKEELVQEGNSAVAPQVPDREGYEFTGWDKSFKNVTEDLVITAQYKKLDDNNNGDDNDNGDNNNNGNDNDNGDSNNNGDDNNNGDNNNNGNNNDNNQNDEDKNEPIIPEDNGNGNSSNSDNNIPQTGGNDWRMAIIASILLCAVGGVILVRNKRKTI